MTSLFRSDGLKFNTKCFNFVKSQVWISLGFTNATLKNALNAWINRLALNVIIVYSLMKVRVNLKDTYTHTYTQTILKNQYNDEKYSP